MKVNVFCYKTQELSIALENAKNRYTPSLRNKGPGVMSLAEKGARDLLTWAIPLDVSKELKSKENSEIVKKIPQLIKEKTQDFGQLPKKV